MQGEKVNPKEGLMKLAFATSLVVLAIAGIESKILTHDILKTDEE